MKNLLLNLTPLLLQKACRRPLFRCASNVTRWRIASCGGSATENGKVGLSDDIGSGKYRIEKGRGPPSQGPRCESRVWAMMPDQGNHMAAL